jgi:integrase
MARLTRHPKSRILYFRKAIPERLRARADMREFKRSSRTTDTRAATKWYAAQAAEYEALMERLEAPEQLPTIASEPVEFISVAPGDIHILAGELWRWILDQHGADPAPRDAFSNSAPNGEWGATNEPWSGHRQQLIRSRLLNRPAFEVGIVKGFADAFLGYKSMHLAPEDYRTFCNAARGTIDGALSDLQRRYRGDFTESKVLASYPLPRREAPKGKPKVKITGLIEAWANGRENERKRTRDEWERRLRQFSEFLDHDDALAVTGKDLRRWRDHLRTTGLKAKTINESCLAPVRAIFAAAEAEEVLPSNPFVGLKIALKEDKTKEKPRRKYTEAEAVKLLTAARKRTDSLRWLTWLMAYTGARINELAQLRKEDVRKEGRINFIRIAPSTDKGHEIKTSASRRDVPLHRAVIAEGFLKYVAKAKDGWLFGELPAGRYGKRGDAASKRYGRWQREEVGIKDKRAVAHSWRHRMEDQLRDIETPEEVANSILGHSLKGQRGTYGEGTPLRVKAEWISRLLVLKDRPR